MRRLPAPKLCTILVKDAAALYLSPQGYSAHIVSTISEWSLAFSFLSFFLTYIQDFQVGVTQLFI